MWLIFDILGGSVIHYVETEYMYVGKHSPRVFTMIYVKSNANIYNHGPSVGNYVGGEISAYSRYGLEHFTRDGMCMR